jgi:hypothetical protein
MGIFFSKAWEAAEKGYREPLSRFLGKVFHFFLFE